MLTWRLPSFWNDLWLDTFYTRLRARFQVDTQTRQAQLRRERIGLGLTRLVTSDADRRHRGSKRQAKQKISHSRCTVYRASLSELIHFRRRRRDASCGLIRMALACSARALLHLFLEANLCHVDVFHISKLSLADFGEFFFL